jgi:hypothetical protein
MLGRSARPTLHAYFARALCASPAIYGTAEQLAFSSGSEGSSSVSKAAQSHLLENWRDFDATKLSPAQMEVCVCFQKVVCFA